MTKNPKLSIITINYNNRDGLEETIKSVAAQTHHNFEYIIIDGGSTDGSVDVIKKYEHYIDYWVSEPDKGIYNAMNKGVSFAHGQYCQFLNSGDRLFSANVIQGIIPFLKNSNSIIYGYTNYIYKNKYKRINYLSPKYLNFHRLLESSIAHPSSFIYTEILKKYPYNEDFKIISDWEFFIKAYSDNVLFTFVPLDITIFDMNGISSTNYNLLLKEKSIIRNKICNENLYNEIRYTPSEITYYFYCIADSIKFKRIICGIIKTILILYIKLKKIGKK